MVFFRRIKEREKKGDSRRRGNPDHAPPKKKCIRANQAPFMAKELNKEIMIRSRLGNKFLRFRSEENKKAYNEQRNQGNRCVKLVRNAKKISL